MIYQKNSIPIQSLDKVMEISKGVFKENEKQLDFLKNCLYYLKEGIKVEHAINMALVDYLLDTL